MIGERPPELDTYRRKRDPARTPEPFGGRDDVRRPAAAGSGRRLFVVQKHAARRLHYDLRLEMGGVLKSWAVPKGPSVRAEEKRLAVHVEDHPIEYADFEGVIPDGNYGAGSVVVWDHGWYRLVKEGDPLEQLARGRLEVELHGFKLRGRWTLARMSGRAAGEEGDGDNWLLLKKAGEGTGETELVDRFPQSVVTGLTVEETRDPDAVRAALRARLDELRAPTRAVDARAQEPMLATLGDAPFSRAGWLFEIKYDGVRVLAERRGDGVTLWARSGQVITARYPEIARAALVLPFADFLLDGEIVATDDAGRPSFQRLQARMGLTDPRDVALAMGQVPVTAVAFDCLALEGRDLRGLPLSARKECLRRVVPSLGVIRFGEHVAEAGQACYDAASDAGLEGIVAKRAASRYAGGRSRDWIKLKCQRRQAFVIGGYTDPQGSRAHFGALHVGLYEPGAAPGAARLVYASKVGTGFDDAALASIRAALQPLRRDASPFAGGPTGAGHHWVAPRLVCDVRFTEWTDDGGLRHPIFMGLRPDVRPEDCRTEAPVALVPVVEEAASPGSLDDAGRAREVREVKLTNLGKIFWPAADGEPALTKGDLVAYYERVAPLLLPYLADRPLVLTRYPDGIAGKSFFQKDAPDFAPSWVRTTRIYSRDTERDIDYLVVDDALMLRYVANMGTIPLHLWGSRVAALDRPDWLVLDLDPKGAPFTDVVRVALAVRGLLDALELPSYPKTSGATGLHVLVPLGARYDYEETRTFARLLALLAVEAVPDIATVARPIGSRGGKVYVDFGQNGHGRTVVGPYSLRPLPGAPASCPLAWSEVTPRLDPARFTLRTLPARFDAMADPLRPVLGAGVDMAAAIARIEGGAVARLTGGDRRALGGGPRRWAGARTRTPEAPRPAAEDTARGDKRRRRG